MAIDCKAIGDPVAEERMRNFAASLSEKDRRRFAALEALG